jgi:hypothetical protein
MPPGPSATAKTLRGLHWSIPRNQSVIGWLPGCMAALDHRGSASDEQDAQSFIARLILPIRCFPPGRMFLWCQTALPRVLGRPGGGMLPRFERRRIDLDRQRRRGDGAHARIVASRRLTALVLCAAVSLTSISLILVSRSAIRRPNKTTIPLASDGGFLFNCRQQRANFAEPFVGE